MTWSKKIRVYKFEESIRQILVTLIGNLGLFLLMSFPDLSHFFHNPHLQASLLSFLFILLPWLFYNWKSQILNALFITIYLLVFSIELLLAGIPESPISMEFGKGILLSLVVNLFPIIYTLLRLIFIYPLIMVFHSRSKL